MLITSLDNDKIKECVKLKEKKYRDNYNKFLVEGDHLVIEAYRSGLLDEVLLEEDSISVLDIPITYVTKEIIEKLSTLECPSHIIGICHKKEENPNYGNKILLLDRVQDPGNLGTILRSSKAFGVDTVVLGDETVDLYNPKVIRSTQGNQFHLNVVSANLKEVIAKLKELEIPIYGTRVEYGEDIRKLSSRDKEKYALIMGNEGRGVNPEILELCDKFIYIELDNEVESLNVAIATSILLYELSRRD